MYPYQELWADLSNFLLSEGQIHVWNVSLDVFPGLVDELAETLGEDEIRRSKTFARVVDRRNFLVRRSLLRQLLSRYSGRDAESLRYEYGSYGKPFLADQNNSKLRFSVSSTGNKAVFAFSKGAEIGVDVEHVRDDFEFEDVMSRYFLESEIREVEALEAFSMEKTSHFYRLWTKKEAWVKLRGVGISGIHDPYGRCNFLELPLGQTYKAWIASEGPLQGVTLIRWANPACLGLV